MAQVNIDREPQGGEGRGLGVAQLFRFRALGSLVFAIACSAIGLLMVIVSVDQVPGPQAAYIGGIGFMLAGLIFVIGWGGAAGHSDLVRYATADHQRMYARIDDRVGDVEEYEREQCDLLGKVVDQVGEARRRHQR